MFDLKDTAVLTYKASTCCTYILHFTWEGFLMKIVNGTRAASATGLYNRFARGVRPLAPRE